MMARLLIENGANVNALGGHYGSALQAAAHGGHKGTAQLLIENGAHILDRVGQYGDALQAAIHGEHTSMVQLLIENGADVKDALQGAIVRSQVAMVRLLLQTDAAINAEGIQHPRALQLAVERGREDIVQLLIKHGANVNARHSQTNDAHMREPTSAPTQALLLERLGRAGVNPDGFSCTNALEAAIMGVNPCQMVETLLRNGANINSRGTNRLFPTALDLAVLVDDYQTSELLIRFEADVNAQGGPFGSVLGAAEALDHPRIAELLISNGARHASPA